MRKCIYLSLPAFTLLLVLLPGCGGDPDPAQETEAEKVLKLLTIGGAWNLQSVTVDGVDRTNLYSGLVLTITASQFNTSNGGAIWPVSTSWRFSNDGGTQIERGDGLIITLENVQQNTFQASLNWNKTTLDGGRSTSLKGLHIFNFTR